jgi:hypothetical protein
MKEVVAYLKDYLYIHLEGNGGEQSKILVRIIEFLDEIRKADLQNMKQGCQYCR